MNSSKSTRNTSNETFLSEYFCARCDVKKDIQIHARTFLYTLTPNFVLAFWFWFCFCFSAFFFYSRSITTHHQQIIKRKKNTKTNWRITQGAFSFDLIFDCILLHTHTHSLNWVRSFFLLLLRVQLMRTKRKSEISVFVIVVVIGVRLLIFVRFFFILF